jgi:hypothetical protein
MSGLTALAGPALPGLAAADTVGGRTAVQVDPGQAFERPSEAAHAVTDGTLVEIHPGDYRGDVAVWTRSDLTLRGPETGPRSDSPARRATVRPRATL